MKTDKSFAGLFGQEPTARILEYLIIGREFSYPIEDIALGTKMRKTTLLPRLETMRKQGLIKKNQNGFATINKDNDRAKILMSVMNRLIKLNIKKIRSS